MCLYRPTSPPNAPRWAPPLHFSPPLFSPLLLSSPLYWVVCRGEGRGGGPGNVQGGWGASYDCGETGWRLGWWMLAQQLLRGGHMYSQSFKSSSNQQQVLKKPSGDRFSQECICLAASVMMIMLITMQKVPSLWKPQEMKTWKYLKSSLFVFCFSFFLLQRDVGCIAWGLMRGRKKKINNNLKFNLCTESHY